MDWTAISAVICTVLGGIGTLIGYQYLRNQSAMDKKIDEIATAAAKNKDEIADFRLAVATKYVDKNELTRTFENLEKSIERLMTAVDNTARETRESFAQLHVKVEGKADK